MIKKYLVTGISIAVVLLLVLGSLSNVVGYQSVKSTTVDDSPLFTTRTQRATNQQQNIITSDYLGKGINSLSFPQRDNRTALIQKIIDRIRTMDDDTFNRFIHYTVIQINNRDNLKNTDIHQFIKEIHNLRTNTENTIFNKELNNNNRTIFFNYVSTVCWFPGCYIIDILYILLMSIVLIMMFRDALHSVLISYCFCPG